MSGFYFRSISNQVLQYLNLTLFPRLFSGMYGLKPEFHNISKFVEDISLDQLLDGSYKSPTDGKDKARKPANVNENILDSVLKAFSILRLHGLQKEKQTEEMDIHVDKKISLISSHSNINVINGSIGEEGSLVASSSISGKASF